MKEKEMKTAKDQWDELTPQEQWDAYLRKCKRLDDLEEEIDYRDQRADDLCT